MKNRCSYEKKAYLQINYLYLYYRIFYQTKLIMAIFHNDQYRFYITQTTINHMPTIIYKYMEHLKVLLTAV